MSTKQNLPKPSEVASTPMYEIAREYLELLDHLEEAAADNLGILPDEELERFDELAGEVTVKIENCCVVIEEMKSKAETVKREKARLHALQGVLESAADRMKDYLRRNMERLGIERSDGRLRRVRIQNSPAKLVMTSESDIPMRLCRTTVTMPTMDHAQLGDLIEWARENGAPESLTEFSEWDALSEPIAAEVKGALKTGEKIKGAHLETNKHIRIW